MAHMENLQKVMCFGFDILIYGCVLQLHSCNLIFQQRCFLFFYYFASPCLYGEANESHQVKAEKEDKCLHVLLKSTLKYFILYFHKWTSVNGVNCLFHAI